MEDAISLRERIDPGVSGELVLRILADPDQVTLRRVIGKSIAVSSGKGGVGKTITTCNLAIFYARKGMRVGLVDLDPLSDVVSLLDIHESEQALQGPKGGGRNPADGVQAHMMPVFRGLEILFPFQKLGAAEVTGVMETIYRRLLREIDGRYDLLLFDMPAGMGYEENLAYIAFMNRLVLVTNPEPTAHASAGAYAKEVQRLYPGKTILLWHNRYSSRVKEGFHPSDVAGNYNRYVGLADRLSPGESALLRDTAFVPEDPALDLLHGEPDPVSHALACMRDSLEYAHGRLLGNASRRLGISRRMQDVVTAYILRHPEIGEPREYLAEFGGYLHGIARAIAGPGAQAAARDAPTAPLPAPFTPQERSALLSFLDRVRESRLRREMMLLQKMLTEQIMKMEEARGPFASRSEGAPNKAIDREIARFLVAANRSARASSLMRSHGVLLLFYFSLHKLFESKTLSGVIKGLIPRKTNRRGRRVRDRFRQIRNLVENDPVYRARYLKAMRALHVIATRQLVTVAKALELPDLVLRDRESRIDAPAYIKLLASFLHETLYSGLSVIVGFDYRSATAAFHNGAERLLEQGEGPVVAMPGIG
jgi:flagellar biosynthesis protein FlhG